MDLSVYQPPGACKRAFMNTDCESEDDEIQILYETAPRPLASISNGRRDKCQMCSQDLTARTLEERESHYRHRHSIKSLSGSRPLSEKSSPFVVPSVPEMKSLNLLKPRTNGTETLNGKGSNDVFWFPRQEQPPPPNISPGLILVLKDALKRSVAKNATRRAVLCYERAVHISREPFDSGWGCGYRNFLMACASLIDQQEQPLYFPLLDHHPSPSVRNLQIWIEEAWNKGYDVDGANEMGHKLVGTKKHIGTGDLHVAFTFRGIPSELIDFDFETVPQAEKVLTDWVMEYFSPPSEGENTVDSVLRGASPVITTDRMPLVLQYPGHSVTIVGYEILKDGAVTLLIFDPSKRPGAKLRNAGLSRTSPSFLQPNTKFHANPFRTVNKILNSTSITVSTSLRRQTRSPSPGPSSKRARHEPLNEIDDDDVVIVEQSTKDKEKSKPAEVRDEDFSDKDVLNFSRWSPARIRYLNFP